MSKSILPTSVPAATSSFSSSASFHTAAPPPGSTFAQVVSVLSDDLRWRGVLAFDHLERRIVFRAEPPLAAAAGGPDRFVGRVLDDHAVGCIRLWLEAARGVKAARHHVEDAVRLVAARQAFHPVRDYLAGLTWDGVGRVATWLEDLCAVVPSSQAHRRMVRAVARKWLISCVARAMTPGCKVDTMLILEGAQGIGKSTALQALAGERFYCDSQLDIRSKEACQTIQGVWIYELPELDALLHHETSVAKAFLSRPCDRFRIPYGRAPELSPRSVVFCGTVNHGGYLKDQTGNRRFWVVRCSGPLDVDGIRRQRDQLWAEARHLFDTGEPWHLDREDDGTMREEHAARLEPDPWEEEVAAWVVARKGEPFTMNELLQSALSLGAQGRNPIVTRRVSRILEMLGFERRRARVVGVGGGASGGTARAYAYVSARLEGPADPTVPTVPTAFVSFSGAADSEGGKRAVSSADVFA